MCAQVSSAQDLAAKPSYSKIKFHLCGAERGRAGRACRSGEGYCSRILAGAYHMLLFIIGISMVSLGPSAYIAQICRSNLITFAQCFSSRWPVRIYYLDFFNLCTFPCVPSPSCPPVPLGPGGEVQGFASTSPAQPPCPLSPFSVL